MKLCILMGSMKLAGNTATLTDSVVNELEKQGIQYEYIWLKYYNILPCKGCFKCQSIDNIPGCIINDDMNNILMGMIDSDCVVFATPIYTWFCTTPMKLVLDRLFSMNKYYGSTKEKYSLLKNTSYSIISTYGNELRTGPDLFEKAIIRLANHSKLEYIGMLEGRDINGVEDFKSEETIKKSKLFVNNLLESIIRANNDN